MLEEGVRDHRHECMTMKALPGSSLEMIETEFFFQLLVSLLANPSRLDVRNVPLSRTTGSSNRPDHLHIGRVQLEVTRNTDRPGKLGIVRVGQDDRWARTAQQRLPTGFKNRMKASKASQDVQARPARHGWRPQCQRPAWACAVFFPAAEGQRRRAALRFAVRVVAKPGGGRNPYDRT
jgi:hypothetical protein